LGASSFFHDTARFPFSLTDFIVSTYACNQNQAVVAFHEF
jgi:hypothetical protein